MLEVFFPAFLQQNFTTLSGVIIIRLGREFITFSSVAAGPNEAVGKFV